MQPRMRLWFLVFQLSAIFYCATSSFVEYLKTEEKQLLLDLHNYHRATVNAVGMRRLIWDGELENSAQTYTKSCFFRKEAAINVFYNTSVIQREAENTITWIVNDWLNNSVEQPVRWYRTSSIGCALTKCRRLTRYTNEPAIFNTFLMACKYSPRYFKSPDGSLYTAGRCRRTSCRPPEASKCLPYSGSVRPHDRLLLLCGNDKDNLTVPAVVTRPSTDICCSVDSISPTNGSVAGGTRLVITGAGFSSDQFEGGNRVSLVREDEVITCDILAYRSSSTRIECETRRAPYGTENRRYSVAVNVSDGYGFVACRKSHNYRYRRSSTPVVRDVSALASSNNVPITLRGLLHNSTGFDYAFENANLNRDFYTRILVGGLDCNPMREDGRWYNATFDATSGKSSIECKPNLDGILDSHNITVVLGRHGNSMILQESNIPSLDNKLRPYHFQTHADILEISPRIGSVGGGTEITITMSHTLSPYADDIVVRIGGMPCDNATIANSTIMCTTRPSPQTSTYYPGGRGWLREIFEGVGQENSTVERLWLDDNKGGTSQKLSGFFIPPASSLYTFNDQTGKDSSRVFLMSTEGLQEIITSENRTSIPQFLEKDHPYYMEINARQRASLGVKLHNSKLHGGEYDSDLESQRIIVQSQQLHEKQLVAVEAQPHVKLIKIQPAPNVTNVGANTCIVPLKVILDGVSKEANISAFSPASTWEHELNQIDLILEIGQVKVFESVSNTTEFTGDSTMTVEIVFLTYFNVSEDQIPLIELNDTITCSKPNISISLTTTSSVAQELVPTPSIMIGFNHTFSQQPRYATVPLNSTSHELNLTLKHLISWGCIEDEDISNKIDFYQTYENESSLLRGHAFCGSQSKKNPSVVRNETFQLNDWPYICFAYKGNISELELNYTINRNTINTQICKCDNWPFPDEPGIDGWYGYGCVDMLGCLSQLHSTNNNGQTTQYTVTEVKFSKPTSGDFYIDNLAFAKSIVNVTRNLSLAPIQPNGHFFINKIILASESQMQLLVPPSITPQSGGMGKYSMRIAEFSIEYHVADCGYGMELIQSSGPNANRVMISRTQSGSMPLNGQLDITIGNTPFKDVQLAHFETLIKNNAGLEMRQQIIGCFKYDWRIRWVRWGDQPPIIVTNPRLTGGASPKVTVETVTNGGVWIRPMRGDMLRLPELDPQVEVIINKIPSSCTSKNCSFNYNESITPTVLQVIPARGQGRINITIIGTSFSSDKDNIQVCIGESLCDIVSANGLVIDCITRPHTAGLYNVTVLVKGKGETSAEKLATFEYIAAVDSVTPVSGDKNGGSIITIAGDGFPLFVNGSREEIGSLSFLPWFRHGVGAPLHTTHHSSNYNSIFSEWYNEPFAFSLSAGDFEEALSNLNSFISQFYSKSPLQVFVGEAPCVIVETTRTSIECVPMPSPKGLQNVTVIVLNQSYVLNDIFSVLDMPSMSVYSLSPSYGPVSGNSAIEITGDSFGCFDSSIGIEVSIGLKPCTVSYCNDTYISCNTPRMNTGIYPVFIANQNEILVPEIILEDFNSSMLSSSFNSSDDDLNLQDRNSSVLFPAFNYSLVVSSISAISGSLLGGTEVVLAGGSFAPGETSVLVGKKRAQLLQVNETMVKFLTPNSSVTHHAKLLDCLACNETNSTMYSLHWTLEEFNISAGDSILWDWDINQNVSQNLELEIFETSSYGSNIPITNGFHSSSSTNNFIVTFTDVGMYYFVSKDNFTGNTTFGKIAVTMPDSSIQPIEAFVDGVRSLYAEYVDINNDDGEDIVPLLENKLEFLYDPSVTPKVTGVMPNIGISNSKFKISGTNFSSENNIVKLGNYSCVPWNQTKEEIVCEIATDATNQPEPYVPLLVSVRNADPGYGLAYIVNRTASTVILYPLITSLDPSEGSLAGGTDVLITGTALNFLQVGMDIQFGGGKCAVKSVEYTMIQCRTVGDFNDSQYNAIQFIVDGKELNYNCMEDVNNCTFSFSQEATAEIYAINPAVIDSPGSQVIALSGGKLSSIEEGYKITFSDIVCEVISANSTDVFCEIPPLPAGEYMLELSITCNNEKNNTGCYGGVKIDEQILLVVEAGVTDISPSQGSVYGETVVTLSGYGLSGSPGDITVAIGGSDCEVVSATHEEVVCITTPTDYSEGLYEVSITDGMSFVITDCTYKYSFQRTPNVTGINPATGSPGETVVIAGLGLVTSTANNVSVTVGGAPCEVQGSANYSTLECRLGLNFAGSHRVRVLVPGLGSSNTDVLFEQELVVTSVSNTTGSLAGGNVLKIEGSGFDPSAVSITICGLECSQTSVPPTMSAIECIVPSANMTNLSCNITLHSLGVNVTNSEKYTYLDSLTAKVSSINNTKGGTEGGTPLLISGSNFTGNVSVYIGSSRCSVISVTEDAKEIVCITGQSGQTLFFPVRVWVSGKGFAISDVQFRYVDIWSSNFTWGGVQPKEGDTVYIPKNHTLILDTRTPVLAGLFIQGGEFIFDQEKADNDVELHIERGIITNGGRLQIGSKENPFVSKTQIVLYGHYLSSEIPSHRTKTLALRHGTIEMHGRPLNVTWTRLRVTAHAGDSEVYVEDHVEWEAGGAIVVASTSFNPNENEERVIQNVTQEPNGSVITLTSPLEYKHISMQQKIAGWSVETRAEVAYLSRSVVVRGNKDEDWYNKVTDCPEEFHPGQFSVQTCLEGRFRSELLGDQFGCQIVVWRTEQQIENRHVQAKMEYVEITHAGQAFRLGRHPLNFHLSGSINGSFIKGCSIHHTFNRAIGITGVDNVVVENNVAFSILGHAYFFEDGNEKYNTLERNLAIHVESSSKLLNTDLTPAAFWVVSPNNTIRGNTAAGGTHFGFWYCFLNNSNNRELNTYTSKLNELPSFQRNTAHSFFWYGLWIFKEYYPSVSFTNDKFENFIAWKNSKGVDFTTVGSLHLCGSVLLDNRLAGIEIEVVKVKDSKKGLMISDSLIVGQSEINEENVCTESGLVTPKSYYLNVSSVTFANFSNSTCVPITACLHCRDNQGGFETRYRNITIVNTEDKITRWKWPHEHIHRDLDGTLTGSNASKTLVPNNNLLLSSNCHSHPPSTQVGIMQGYVCPGDVRFGRLAIFNASSRRNGLPLNVSNEQGDIMTLPYLTSLLLPQGESGWMMNLQLNHTYTVGFEESVFSYTVQVNAFSEYDYVVLKHTYQEAPDLVHINGVSASSDASFFSNLNIRKTGDFYKDDDNHTLFYIIKGGDFEGKSVMFGTSKCSNCFSSTPSKLPSTSSISRSSSSIVDLPSVTMNSQLSLATSDIHVANSSTQFSQSSLLTSNLRQAISTIPPSLSLSVLGVSSTYLASSSMLLDSSYDPQVMSSPTTLRDMHSTSRLLPSTSNSQDPSLTLLPSPTPSDLPHLNLTIQFSPTPTITTTNSFLQLPQSSSSSNLQASSTTQLFPSSKSIINMSSSNLASSMSTLQDVHSTSQLLPSTSNLQDASSTLLLSSTLSDLLHPHSTLQLSPTPINSSLHLQSSLSTNLSSNLQGSSTTQLFPSSKSIIDRSSSNLTSFMSTLQDVHSTSQLLPSTSNLQDASSTLLLFATLSDLLHPNSTLQLSPTPIIATNSSLHLQSSLSTNLSSNLRASSATQLFPSSKSIIDMSSSNLASSMSTLQDVHSTSQLLPSTSNLQDASSTLLLSATLSDLPHPNSTLQLSPTPIIATNSSLHLQSSLSTNLSSNLRASSATQLFPSSKSIIGMSSSNLASSMSTLQDVHSTSQLLPSTSNLQDASSTLLLSATLSDLPHPNSTLQLSPTPIIATNSSLHLQSSLSTNLSSNLQASSTAQLSPSNILDTNSTSSQLSPSTSNTSDASSSILHSSSLMDPSTTLHVSPIPLSITANSSLQFPLSSLSSNLQQDSSISQFPPSLSIQGTSSTYLTASQDLHSTSQLLPSTSNSQDAISNLSPSPTFTLLDSSSTFHPSPIPTATATTPISQQPYIVALWSNSSIWSNNSLPGSGVNVTIPSHLHVKVDIRLPKMEVLLIKGILEFEDNDTQEYALQATMIIIEGGGKLVAGTKEKPLNNDFKIILYGNRSTPFYFNRSLEIDIGPRSIGVWGEFILHSSMQNSKSWTLLSQTATALSNEITLTEAVNWEVGDEIVITSTSYNAYQTETFTIANVTDNIVLTLNASLNHIHLGIEETIDSVSYSVQAEVGRLTQKIVIENGDPDTSFDEKFGCRVVVSNGTGIIQLQGVEFKGCGQQIRQSDQSGVQFALAFVNASFQGSSYVNQCSFHHSHSIAIGLIGTDSVELVGNVIHDTLGPSMQVAGIGHRIIGNLASLSRTNEDHNDSVNDLWSANFEIVNAEAINFTYNHAAGGAGIGIHTNGEDCVEPSSVIQHNVAHSSFHCFHMGYTDGTKTECSRHFNITAYACHHYGFFGYSSSSVHLLESTFVNNKVAVYATVVGPPALSHSVGMKTVLIENVRVISASKTFNCLQDEVVPRISHGLPSNFRGLLSPSGGHVGIIHPTFVSKHGGFPQFPWPSIQGYPAISGITNINQVSFINFGLRCRNYKDVVIMTNKFSEDANHPVFFRDITFKSDGRFALDGTGIYQKYKVFVHQPNLDSVNPADCVDMDCDGMKSVILTDVDGTFTETSFSTIISKAEFEWDGDPRRQLGDNRIPLSLLMRPDGSLTAEENYQQKGAVRGIGFGSTANCSFISEWNMYLCHNLQHLLLVIESLDDDAEVRRLSPVGVSGNGYINLINGPKDHGWCGGYTCQERLSTFYIIVASSFIYTIGFNSTAPQKMALHLLNSNKSQNIVAQIVYTYLQRFDVYINESGRDVYVPPGNANFSADGNLAYGNFGEPFDNRHGANYFNRSLNQLLIYIEGSQTYKIIAAPVLYLSVTISTTVDNYADSFTSHLIRLLNIQMTQIRIVRNFQTQASSKRRKREVDRIERIEIEIGDPPPVILLEDGSNSVNISMLTGTESDTFGATNNTNQPAVMNGTDFNSGINNATAEGISLNYERLLEISDVVTEMIQTKQLLQEGTDVTLMEAEIVEPPGPAVDPTGGIRATQATGGLHPGDNGTDGLLTFSQQQWLNESTEANTTALMYKLLIPSQLVLTNGFTSPVLEGIPSSGSAAPEFAMYNENHEITETLGIRNPWKLTATATHGPEHGFLSNNVVEFVKGRASFKGLVFSHPGTYHLVFSVTVPINANFSNSLEVSVQKRNLSLILKQQPQNGNTTFPLYPYPSIRLTEDMDQLVPDHDWRNSTWYIIAKLVNTNQEWSMLLNNGVAVFRNIKIWTPGTHQLIFNAITSPSSSSVLPTTEKSVSFNITKFQFTRFTITYKSILSADFEGKETDILALFLQRFSSQFKGVENFNTTIHLGPDGVVISTFITANNTGGLINAVNSLNNKGTEKLTIQFQNQTLIPSAIIQDPNYPVPGLHHNNYFVPTLSATIPIIVVLLFGAVLLGTILFCRQKYVKNNLEVKSTTMKSTSRLNQDSGSQDRGSVAEFYLIDYNHKELAINPSNNEKEVISHTWELVERPGLLIANPCALEDNAEAKTTC